ncbi:MAG: molybdopterin cofactor-binding domain-containing protein, partial [Pseudomonadota bacterium]
MFLFENDAPWIDRSTAKSTETIKIVNVSRRQFLKTSAFAAGSTFALGLFSGCEPNAEPYTDPKVPAQGTMAESGFQPNVFLGINDAGDVFIVCSRSEMGQGIRTGMPPVIADELEADWNRVHVVQGDGDPKYGDQNTDGSRSVRNHFTEWRQAGATARAMLIAAAAQTWKVPAEECEAINHVVTHTPSGRTMGYGELAATAATLEVPTDVTLKSRDEWKFIGKYMRGVDNRAIASGTATFGIDATAPGMVYASIERCPVIGGSVVSYDDAAALAIPGVQQVIKLEDAPLPPAFRALGGLAVVASNTWSAFQGRKALEIEWDRGPNTSYNSPAYRTTLEQSAGNTGREIRNMGDITPAFASAEQTLEAMYYVPMLAHAPMEPPNALAWVKEDDTCEIWAPTQDPQTALNVVAGALDLTPEQVTMHVTLLGGGFG